MPGPDSSFELGVPRGDTYSEAGQRGGDSTIDFPANKIPLSHQPGSTVFNEHQPRSMSPPELPNAAKLGDYRIERKVGEGAMGEVYQATQISLDRLVALKILPSEYRRNATLVERFTREAKSLAGLDHPHIVRVYSTGEVNQRLYVALEFVNGQTLQECIDTQGHLTVGDALHVTLVCAWALQHAHERGIVHRDVKPSNVLVTLDGVCKVADFGLVKMIATELGTTTSGTALGTPDYMAPEQCINARTASPRSDIYSIGVMLYVMLTGVLPFKGESLLDCVTLKQTGHLKSAKALNPDVPEKLDLILGKLLAPAPEHRYATCMDLIHDIATMCPHNDSLSFVTHPHPYFAYGPWTGIAAAAQAKAAAKALADASQSKTEKPSVLGPIQTADKFWYVHYKNRLGKPVVLKKMTDEVIIALEKKLIPVTALVKPSPTDPFTKLVDHPEFHPVLSRLGVKIQPRGPQDPAVAATPKKKRRRRRRINEILDLAARIGMGLAAVYGLIRGLFDLIGLWK